MIVTSPQEFVAKWRNTSLRERAAAQEHFIDLCRLVGHQTPAEADPTGTSFTFEAGVDKVEGGKGWADVWKKGFFGWEYKGKHADLDKAYQQLLQYRESLQNPPLLIVCDIDKIVIHTNFTNTIKQTITLTFDDLLTTQGRQHLHNIFHNPRAFRAATTTEQVTQEAAREFAKLSAYLREANHEPDQIAHFLIRLLFCLFAEDIGLLPKDLFTRLIATAYRHLNQFAQQLRQLFGAMATGGFFGVDDIRHFNGGLFDNDAVLDLPREAISTLERVAKLDWSSIEPSILGTLFERSLDPSKRAQLGAHYTSKEDILLIVEPVLMAPLRRRWEEVKAEASTLVEKRKGAGSRSAETNYRNQLQSLLDAFAQELASVRVLDPACGSGNFLYVALRQLLDLWKEVSIFAGEQGLPLMAPIPTFSPSPEQLYGIEINPYAHELAQATVWIGYIQWSHENGFGVPGEPILKPLDNIKNMDAILAYDEEGKPIEPEWPEAEIIIGNPPFLGGNKIRAELGDNYVNSVFMLYGGRIPAFADLVCYWFERARKQIETNHIKRVGLLSTDSIRGGANRAVLAQIKKIGDIFWAISSREWILDGAAVNVSMIGFDNGAETLRELDGGAVIQINSDLTAQIDLTQAIQLVENASICFMGASPKGPFDVDYKIAQEMLAAPINVNGKSNLDVVRPVVSGIDIVRRSRNKWTIDFGMMSESDAAAYELPFEYLKRYVYPIRVKNNRASYRLRWWQYAEPRPGMRSALDGKYRFIATPEVAKYRIFVWIQAESLCNQQTLVFARDDDYFLGILHSSLHELWSLRQGTSLEDRPRYTPTTTFETFPFPWPPGQEPNDNPCVQAIAQAAKELVEKRDNWLNPPGLSEKELKKRTLTNLYNQRPTWLDRAHRKLDQAVLAAYGWSDLMTNNDIDEEEILARLLALNLARSKDTWTSNA